MSVAGAAWSNVKVFSAFISPPHVHLGRLATTRGLSGAAQEAMFRAVERGATLALAFCHAHEIAAADLVEYGNIEEARGDEAGAPRAALLADNAPLQELAEGVKQNVMQQVCCPSHLHSQAGLPDCTMLVT